jgi:uncharacterized protein (DUF1778 family)
MSAFVSDSTKELIERYAEAHGVKKAYLVEEALLHHLQALKELPADVIIPPRVVVDRQSGERLIELLEGPAKPTKAMRELFDHE